METGINFGNIHNGIDEMEDGLGVKSLEVPLGSYFSEVASFGDGIDGCPAQNMDLQVGGRFEHDLMSAEHNGEEHCEVEEKADALGWKDVASGEHVEQRLDAKKEASTLEKRDEYLYPLDPKKKANEWRNELLSFPQLFNQVFLSLYRYNEYIDQKWSVLDESHSRLYNLLLQIAKSSSPTNFLEPQDSDNVFITEKHMCNTKTYSRHMNNYFPHLLLHLKVTNIYIPGTEFSNENKILENELKMKLYDEIFNRFQTCKNDIEITFERKSEMVSELDSKIKRIVSSIERFIDSNQSLIESHTKPLYNIDNSEIGEIGIVKRRTGVRGRPPGSGNRGRPPGSGNRGRPPGSTKKAKKAPI